MVMQANWYDDTHVQGSLKPFVFNQKNGLQIKYLWVGRFLWKSARNCPLVEKHFPNSFYLHKIFPEKPVEYIIGIFFKVVNSIACRNRRHTKIMHFHQKKKKKEEEKKNFPHLCIWYMVSTFECVCLSKHDEFDYM